jgi:hypothetical protein
MNSNQPAVDYGEVIVVENTPPHPPPLPEPPPFINGFDYSIHRWLHSSTSTDGEKKFLFRSMYQVHNDDDDDDTATITTTTATVQRPLSSTVPSSASGYSNTTIDGELILSCRLAYRVNRLYGVGKILSSIELLQPGPVHDDTTTTMQLVKDDDDTIAVLQLVLYQDKYKTIRPFHLSTTGPATAPDTATTDTATTTDGELILLFRLAYRVDGMYQAGKILSSIVLLLLYQDDFDTSKKKERKDNNIVISTFGGSDSEDSNNSYDGRPATPSATAPDDNNDDTIASKQLVALFQVRYKMKRPFDIMQLVVLYQDFHEDDHTIVIT